MRTINTIRSSKTLGIKTVLGIAAFAAPALCAHASTVNDTVKPDIAVKLSFTGGLNTSGLDLSNVGAGPFDATISGVSGVSSTQHFDAYCVDLNHYLQGAQDTTIASARASLKNGAQIAYLYNTFAPFVGADTVKGAALQLSIWETEYDYNAASTAANKGLDFGSGSFQFLNTTDPTLNTAVMNQAKSDISSLLQYGTNYAGDVTYLGATHNGNTGQSLIGPASVPEPGAVSLAVSSLIGLSVFAKRRKRS